MGFLTVMKERGLVAQITHEDELQGHLKTPRAAYIGFDPTAPSLHVGHLLQVMTLRRWQQAGNRVIAVVGGGTAMVGDPTGKTDLRQMLSPAQIQSNMVGMQRQLAKLIDFSTPARAIIVNNADWLAPLNYLTFLREIGPHFSVNRMLTAECFKQRLEKGLSFLEFNYMLLQSYDFLHLYREEACTLQLGGDDQWSNILAGMELVRRIGGGQAFCLTTPLLTTSDGRKMGKTEKGAVWLDSELTPVFDYFQYWRNVEDAGVATCLAYFTELPMSDVRALVAEGGAALNFTKLVLAYECTELVHGKAAAQAALAKTQSLFPSPHVTKAAERYQINADGVPGEAPDAALPELTLAAAALAGEDGSGLLVADFLVLTAVVPSKGEARRLIQQGGLAINGEKVEDITYKVTPKDFPKASGCLLKRGKKHYYRIRISG